MKFKSFTIGDCMTRTPQTIGEKVTLSTAKDFMEVSLAKVVKEMAHEKYGCAVIQDGKGAVLGVFTTVDVCRVLAEILGD